MADRRTKIEREELRRTVELHGPMVYRLAFRVLRNRADAEDAAQEVFVQYVKARRKASVEKPRAWLAITALNTARNLVRQERNRRRRQEVWAERRARESLPEQPLPEVDTKGLNLDVAHKEPQEYIRCMYDLVYLAFVTDSTRYATLMLESEQSSTSEMWNYATYVLGYKGATHDIAHKRPADYSGQWDRWRAEQHAYFLKRLRNTAEGDGNLLDNTVVLWGSAHPHASHSTRNYPIHLAGGNKFGFKHGRLHEFIGDRKVPLANLFVSMLNAVDVPVEKFADSTGNMSQLMRG